MGSLLEINDTLQLTPEQGFPVDILNVEIHQQNPVSMKDVEGKVFEFFGKSKARFFHVPPTRCFLVENRNGKWIFWGKVFILEQTIHSSDDGNSTTSGKYKIIEVYDPEYQKMCTRRESKPGLSYF